MGRTIRSILDRFRAARRTFVCRADVSQSAVASLDEGFKSWKELGGAFGLDERVERERRASGDFEISVPRSAWPMVVTE